MTGHLLDMASEILHQRGFEVWEVFLVERRSQLVERVGGRTGRTYSALDRGCGVRGLLEGRTGHSSTTHLDGEGLSECADALITSVHCGSTGGILPLPSRSPPSETFEAYDPATETLTTEQLASLAAEAEASALAAPHSGPRTMECLCRSGHGEVAVRNSFGIDARFRFSRLSVQLESKTSSAQGPALGPVWTFGYGPAGLDPRALGVEFSRLYAARASAGPAKAGRTTLVLSPRASAHLTDLFSFLVDGEAAPIEPASSNSPDEALGSSALTLLDDGRLPGGYGSTPFDGEGSVTGSCTFIEKGVRTCFAHTSTSAARAGSVSTGHALRPDFAFPPRLGFHNLHLAPTPKDPRGTLREIKEGLYLEDLWEVPARGQPPGRLALEGWGYSISRGELAVPVESVRFSETLGGLLLRLAEVAPDLATFPGGLGGATCLIEDVPIGT